MVDASLIFSDGQTLYPYSNGDKVDSTNVVDLWQGKVSLPNLDVWGNTAPINLSGVWNVVLSEGIGTYGINVELYASDGTSALYLGGHNLGSVYFPGGSEAGTRRSLTITPGTEIPLIYKYLGVVYSIYETTSSGRVNSFLSLDAEKSG